MVTLYCVQILLVNGRDGIYDRDNSYVYDAALDTYTETENGNLLRAKSRMDCVVDPRDENIVICAGAWKTSGIDESLSINILYSLVLALIRLIFTLL